MSSTACKAAIFDIDGTLVDSNDTHAYAWWEALAGAGYPVEYNRVRTLIGVGADRLLPALIGKTVDSAEGKAITSRRAVIFAAYAPMLGPTRGAELLLARLKAEGTILVVATSAEGGEARRLLEIAGATEYFDASTSSSDVARSKPDPDIVHAALGRAHVGPSDAILIGDTPYDIEAAARAGVAAIALRCGGLWTDEDLAGAIAIYDDPAHLLREIADSPLA